MTGRKLKNYQIEELLGEGGMGVVYRAKDVNLNRMVALKMLHPDMLHQPDLLRRFKNEAHVTARLTHPNIATLYNFFSEDDLHCLVMEYVKGKTLAEILQVHKRLPSGECIRILMQLMEGLEEAHSNEILHRDIKPGNIMINQSGYVKLMDFGVARFESSARITRMNRVIGTLEYMAPELLTGGKPNIQADLYSVGVVAFEMYTGKLPFEADQDGELTQAILKGNYSYPRFSVSEDFHQNKKLESIINKLMVKKTSKRYLNSKEVLADLNECGITGRVSTEILGKEPLTIVHSDEKRDLFPKMIEKAKEFAFNIPRHFPAALQSARKSVREKYPAVKEFFKTFEGKLIGGAVGFAIGLFLFANLFSDSGQENQLSGAVESEPAEEVAVNYSGLSGDGSNDSTSGDEQDNSVDGEESLRAPSPIVIPTREPESEFGSGRSSRQGAIVSNPQDEAKEGGEQTDAGDDPSNNRENRIINDRESTRSETGSVNNDRNQERAPSTRTIPVSVGDQFVEGIFDEPVSTLTHQEGDTFYLTVAADVYADGYRVIAAGANIRGVVQQVRDRGQSRRATLAVSFEEVQAVDGSWLSVSYPEYSNQATGSVTFEKGRSISRLRIESGTVTLELE
jgi:serine/threonine-protein kinase